MIFGMEKDGEPVVDLQLPKNDPANQDFLRAFKKKGGRCKMAVGLPKWTQGNWTRTFYPRGTRSGGYLKYYAGQVNSVELNATRYWSHFNSGQVKKWLAHTPSGFKFCPKFFERISHGRRLDPTDFLNAEWIKSLEGFGDKLGPAFLQLRETFSPGRREELFNYLDHFPDQYPLALELRHPGWYERGRLSDSLSDFLTRRRIACVMTDTPLKRDVLHQRLTAPYAFVRFCVGLSAKANKERLDQWARRIDEWSGQGIEAVYFFIHHPKDTGLAETLVYFIRLLNQKGYEMPVPALEKPIFEQPDLFEG